METTQTTELEKAAQELNDKFKKGVDVLDDLGEKETKSELVKISNGRVEFLITPDLVEEYREKGFHIVYTEKDAENHLADGKVEKFDDEESE